MDANFWTIEVVGEHALRRQLLNSDLWWSQLYGSFVKCASLNIICSGFQERRECWDENESLRITTILVWNSKEKYKKEIDG